MTSLNGHDKTNQSWVESIFRGFDNFGLSIFMNHSCIPQKDSSFCRDERRFKRKRCIVENHEISLAWQFPAAGESKSSTNEHKVQALYNGDVADEYMVNGSFPTWITNFPYWKHVMVQQQGFPAAKVKSIEMVAANTDPILDKCTMHLDRTTFWSEIQHLLSQKPSWVGRVRYRKQKTGPKQLPVTNKTTYTTTSSDSNT